ncbi:hypothetical protein AA313_de0205149 [Arthrobotrys entomopaga]|nr:hypothetical protein AA313_de0205149 [Arthrobotrys entomopaga]
MERRITNRGGRQTIIEDEYYDYPRNGAEAARNRLEPGGPLDRTVMGTDGRPLHLQTEYEYYTLGIPRPGQHDADPSRWRTGGERGAGRARDTRAPFSPMDQRGGYDDYGYGMGAHDPYQQPNYRGDGGGYYGQGGLGGEYEGYGTPMRGMGRAGRTRGEGGGRGQGRDEDGIPAHLIEGELEFVGEGGTFVQGGGLGGRDQFGGRGGYEETGGRGGLTDRFGGMGLGDERTGRGGRTPRRDRGPGREDRRERELRHQVALDFRLDPRALSLLPLDYQNFDFQRFQETVFFTSNYDLFFGKRKALNKGVDIPQVEYGRQRNRRQDRNDGTYELPKSDNYEKNFQIVKKHNSGAFGATAILKVLESATSKWKAVVRPGTKIIGKRICLKDSKTVARSYDREVKMLSTIKGGKNILKILGFHKSERGDPYGHIFTEFCELGDVEALFKKYGDARKYMPEGFLQQLTLDMSKALLFLERGSDSLSQSRKPGWISIIHNDIKPNNIFMKSRPRGSKSVYPIFVMGDFGLASKATEPAEPSCPHYMSPRRIDDAKSRRQRPSTQMDDIFSVFVSMFLLCTHEFSFHTLRDGIEPLDFKKPREFKAPYTPWFGSLICKGCTADEKFRPTAREALEKILKHTGQEGWGKGGSKSRLWEINWLDKGVVAKWDDNKDKKE